jgi:hypothetical protein
MTCKDCIHYCLCKDTLADENWREDTPQEIKDMYSPKGCENFKNKDNFKEVKHGHWKKTNYVEVRCCSICDKPSNVSKGIPKYCPNCGAEMIKENE